jgi:hypothetical protein
MSRRLTPEIREAIERAATEEGVDPSLALAIAERESNFDPRARSSKTIRGMFQMRGDLRNQYGVGDSDDPYTQAKGWSRFIKDTKGEMATRAGRDVSDDEAYAGHHFGAGRAGRMLNMDPETPVSEVFTPYERSINPHFDRAGTVGSLLGSVTGDIAKKRSAYGGADLDFSQFGEPVEGGQTAMASAAPEAMDFSQMAEPA